MSEKLNNLLNVIDEVLLASLAKKDGEKFTIIDEIDININMLRSLIKKGVKFNIQTFEEIKKVYSKTELEIPKDIIEYFRNVK